MSLPASQQRVLDGMDRALQADEPHMASMFAIFARLNEGTEPVGAEPLKRRRWRDPRSSQSGRGMYAMALIPVLFIMVVAGVLLGGSAHGLTTCGSGSAAFGSSPWVTRSSSCAASGKTASGKTASGSTTTGSVHGSAGSSGSKDPKGAAAISGSGTVSCAAIALTVRAARTGVRQPPVPPQSPQSPASATAETQPSSAMCYK